MEEETRLRSLGSRLRLRTRLLLVEPALSLAVGIRKPCESSSHTNFMVATACRFGIFFLVIIIMIIIIIKVGG